VAHDRKFRFAVICEKLVSGPAYREVARKAEALGYSTLFAPDHFVDHPIAPIPALAAAAAVTDTLKIGTLVLGNDYRHPVVLAQEVATLDAISDGRLEFGLGAGWMQVDYEKSGIPLDSPGVRIARLEESVEVIKGLLADGPFSYDGTYYKIDGLEGTPSPVQNPIPWIIGGGAPKILGVAARHADIVGINANLRSGAPNTSDAALSLASPAVDQKLVWLKEAAGDRYADLEIQTLIGFVHFTDDREAIAQGMANSFGVAPEEAMETPVVLVGTKEQMIEGLHRRRERWDMSYHVVGVDFMEAFAPIVAELSGT
jgi:probable F420-dependent oxidoreductase